MRGGLLAVAAILLIGAGTARAQDSGGDENLWSKGISAETRERALTLYREGNAQFEQSEYRGALASYRKAIEIWDHPAIRYNMAVSMIHLEQPLAAFTELGLALRYEAAPFSPEDYAQAQTYFKLLRGQLADLEVVCEEAGAEVRLDGELLFTAPGKATRTLAPGKHQLVASKKGYLTESRALNLTPGQLNVETVELVTLEAGTETRTTRRWSGWKPWAVVGAGVGVAAIGAVFELKAQADIDEYDEDFAELCPTGCAEDELPGAVRDLKTRAELEDAIGLGAIATGGALIVTGAILVVLNQPRIETVERPRMTVAPTRGGATVSFELSF